MEEAKKVYTESTPRLIELHKSYVGRKNVVKNYVDIEYFDNVNSSDETGYFWASHLREFTYNHIGGYTKLSEQEFIEFMGLEDCQLVSNNAKKETSGKLSYEIDWTFIKHMAERMDSNKGKYEPYNWVKPMSNPKDLLNAITRHLVALHEGVMEDDGRPYGHIEAIACDAMMYFRQIVNK
ncbi:MAG TPA: dATP/dGTP diphosphohydrolase domain-containing protein [Ureibacillus sp.]|nr:dATP/dGTP diphosphohydrolase domain-containing protein [Ureibacillus sp.]